MTIDAAIFRGSKASDVYFRENTYAGEYVDQDQFDQRLRYASDYWASFFKNPRFIGTSLILLDSLDGKGILRVEGNPFPIHQSFT